MESYNLVWVLVGGNYNIYVGEQLQYSLIEFFLDTDTLEFSRFKKSCIYCINPNSFINTNEQKILDTMIKEGKKILFKISDHKYGYFSNVLNGIYIFNDTENINIENKLKELIFSKCVK